MISPLIIPPPDLASELGIIIMIMDMLAGSCHSIHSKFHSSSLSKSTYDSGHSLYQPRIHTLYSADEPYLKTVCPKPKPDLVHSVPLCCTIGKIIFVQKYDSGQSVNPPRLHTLHSAVMINPLLIPPPDLASELGIIMMIMDMVVGSRHSIHLWIAQCYQTRHSPR